MENPGTVNWRCILQTVKGVLEKIKASSVHFLPVGNDKSNAIVLPRSIPMAEKQRHLLGL